MNSFQRYLPGELDRIIWYRKGYRVLCNNCWFVGQDENYDYCPDCHSDRLEWILDELIHVQYSLTKQKSL
jgi:hypothetical protein